MTDKPKHLCLTCELAEWRKTETGRIHPDGGGECQWKLSHVPMAAAFRRSVLYGGGYIERMPSRPIVSCETYKAKDEAIIELEMPDLRDEP